MTFNDAIKIQVSEYILSLIEEEQEMIRRQPKDKESLRKQIAVDVERFLEQGGRIEVLPPGKSTNLDHEESWRSFSL
jgi:hypothetical protein